MFVVGRVFGSLINEIKFIYTYETMTRKSDTHDTSAKAVSDLILIDSKTLSPEI